MKFNMRMCEREDCGTIYTGDRGVPVSVAPCRDDYNEALPFHQALWAHRDRVTAHFSLEFQKHFGKALRRGG
jgi:hypothetical protein